MYTDYEYIESDILTFDYCYMRALHKKMLYRQNHDIYDCDWRFGSAPWCVYSTNKYPVWKQQEVVKFLCEKFCEEFGTVFGKIFVYGGNHPFVNYLGQDDKESDWRPEQDLTIHKSYIKRNSDGWVVIVNVKRFESDLRRFEREMKKEFAELHYSWDELSRLNKFLICPDRLRKKNLHSLSSE